MATGWKSFRSVGVHRDGCVETISRAAMKEADRRAIEEFGIPGVVLMENAALQAVRDLEGYSSFTVLCAPGNNGGDGLAVARHVFLLGGTVEIYIVGDPERGTPDFTTNLRILEKLSPNSLHVLAEENLEEFEAAVRRSEANVDALFGIGLTRAVSGLHKKAVEVLNRSSRLTLALDVPSGVDADTGEILGGAVRAHQTVTFHRMKRGLLLEPAAICAGTVRVAYVGIP